jgi:hypothetical protein
MNVTRRRAPKPADVLENVEEHPATQAWLRVSPGSAVPMRIEQFARPGKVRKKRKSSVFRLHGVGTGSETIVAKRGNRATVALELLVYETFLARLPLSSLRVLGSLMEPDNETQWFFVEDAGDCHFSRADPEHRALAARWLATLHTGAATLVEIEQLPRRSSDFYLDFLREALAIMKETESTYPTLARRVALDDMERVARLLEMRWTELDRFCDALGTTLVHGDFIDKNVRVGRDNGGDIPLFVFDWEMAGRASPAIDLATSNWGAHDDGIRAYLGVACQHWNGLTYKDVKGMLEVGRVFRYVASIRWLCESLRFREAEKPLQKISGYLQRLSTVASLPI